MGKIKKISDIQKGRYHWIPWKDQQNHERYLDQQSVNTRNCGMMIKQMQPLLDNTRLKKSKLTKNAIYYWWTTNLSRDWKSNQNIKIFSVTNSAEIMGLFIIKSQQNWW